METHRKTVRIPLDILGSEEARLTEVLIDMGYEWSITYFRDWDSKTSWIELQLPDDVHFYSALRAVRHALRDMGSNATPGEPLVIG